MSAERAEQQPPLIGIVGPTASGKTAAGIALAERLDGEIVSADAVAVYRGLDIGAAKPDREERSRVPFHLIDVVSPVEEFTLADFERLANAAIADIRARGKTPILVGGTGLYVRSVTATLTVPNVPPQPAIRKRLWAEAETNGAPFLHARLAEIDPASAAKIAENDAKRMIRALEVWEVTGQPMSAFHTPEGVYGVPRRNTYLYGLRWDRETLYLRIENRVDRMLADGFLDEVRGLLYDGYSPSLRAMQSLGYRHLCAYLTRGGTLDEAIEELKRDTRRYAKRQLIWFRADPQVRWIDVWADGAEIAPDAKVSGPMADAVAELIIGSLRKASQTNSAGAGGR